MTQTLFDQIHEAKDFILSHLEETPLASSPLKFGIILGTGLGKLAQEIEVVTRLTYNQIPYFVKPTVEFHQGELIIGFLENQPVCMMNGRFHLYEGYSSEQITFPVRVIKALGAHSLIVSNACGTVNPKFKAGDLMLIKDHLNLLGTNPLIGPNDNRLGSRFPDMSKPYAPLYLEQMKNLATSLNIDLKQGIYASMTGPSLETAAEYRMLQIIGADVIGMSTVPEVIVAAHCNLATVAISIITDECFPESLKEVDINEIIATANQAEPKLISLIKSFLKQANFVS